MWTNIRPYRSLPDTYITKAKGVWIVAKIYRFFKRRRVLLALFALLGSGLILSYKRVLICSNTQPHYYIKEICKDYQSGISIGNLCDDLCVLGGITSITCQTFHMGKEEVFSGVQGNRSLFFKLPKQTRKIIHLRQSSLV